MVAKSQLGSDVARSDWVKCDMVNDKRAMRELGCLPHKRQIYGEEGHLRECNDEQKLSVLIGM